MEEQEAIQYSIKIILVVEDDTDNREVLETVIAMETPYRTLLMECGQEMLQRIEEIKVVKPALFLLDYHLPAMTALELYDRLHRMEVFKHVPTLIISVSQPSSMIDEIAKRGLTFLEKPFEVETLVTAMKHIIDASSI
jgi:CheY-like chemotaxis protein